MSITFFPIKNGQYKVKMDITVLIDDTERKEFEEQVKTTASPIVSYENGILEYTSETILPQQTETDKQKLLFVFGNPATHSVTNGMFFFSKQNNHRHSLWKKLATADVVKMVKGRLSRSFEARQEEAEKRRRMLFDGYTSDRYLVGLTTFYSYPTSADGGVNNVEELFQPIIDKINERETERILGYDFSKDATLIFVQKSSYDAFKSVNGNRYNNILFWPIRGSGSSGLALEALLKNDNMDSCMPHNEDAKITESAILFRIGKLYRDGLSDMELYDITRGRWRLGKRRENAKLGFSVFNNEIIEVYDILQWFHGGDTFSSRTDPAPPDRWEFVGNIANEKYRKKYIGKSVAHYFKDGARNPVCYINI